VNCSRCETDFSPFDARRNPTTAALICPSCSEEIQGEEREATALRRLHEVAVNSELLKGQLQEGLGAKICREARGSQTCRAFGPTVGVTAQYINRVERGHDVPSLAFFAKLAAVLIASRAT